MLAHAARIGGIAAAAFLSLATSSEVDEVNSTRPLPLDTAVPVDVVPAVILSTSPDLDVDPAPRIVVERASDGTAVAGGFSVDGTQAGVELAFSPDAPLDPDTDYVFVVDGALAGYFYVDLVTGESLRLGENGAPNRIEIPFSTASDPVVRFARASTDPRVIRVSFSQDMAPLTVSTNTVKVIADDVERDTQLVIYRGGALHEAEVTLFDAAADTLELSFESGIEAADGTAMTPAIVPVD